MPRDYSWPATGPAALLKHRVSEDLDFVTNEAFDSERIIQELQRADPDGEQGLLATNTVYWFAGGDRKQKASFISAEGTPSSVESHVVGGRTVRIASLLDIAAMKSVAIIGRIEKKDDVDIAAIMHIGQIGLGDILTYNRQKLRRTGYDERTFIRALA